MPKASPKIKGKTKKQASPTPKDKSFVFRDIVNVVKSTGSKACTLSELRDGLALASNNCVFHHTYQFFLRGHVHHDARAGRMSGGDARKQPTQQRAEQALRPVRNHP